MNKEKKFKTNREVLELANISEEDKDLAASIADKAGWTPLETASHYFLACLSKRSVPLLFTDLYLEENENK